MNNFKDKFNSFFFLDDEGELDRVEEIEEKQIEPTYEDNNRTEKNETLKTNQWARKKSGRENVVAINQKQALQKPQITIIEPRLYSEVQEISDHLLSNQSIIVNFRRMDHEQATKVIDFLMGVTYAIKGDIQRLDDEIFICTPQSVTVNGSDLSEFSESLL